MILDGNRLELARTATEEQPLAATEAAAARTGPVQNDRVSVFDETIRPGETIRWGGARPNVIVYFNDGSLEVAEGSGQSAQIKVSRGDSVFETATLRTATNVGKTGVHYARIELLGSGLADTWGASGLSPNYKLLFENRYARVYEIRIPAGTSEPQHSHHERVVVCLSGARLEHLMPDGRREPSTLRTGEIGWRRGGTHIGRNLGSTDLWVIAVEPK
jgi:quercetin dioxygenase-like cupin family protein